MHAKFFTPAELREMEQEDSRCLLAAALLQVEQLQQRSAQLKDAQQRLKELNALLAAAQSEAKRQAAPFRVPEAKRVSTPKRPGRPPGHRGSFRPRPTKIHADFSVPLELCPCPHCGAQDWSPPQELEQFIEDLPVIEPHVTRLCTYQSTCAGCGETLASRHPLQVSQAGGAAGTHLGPRALALAADLNKAKHLSTRKTCAVLADHFNLKLTPGGLCQAMARVADGLAPQRDQLQRELVTAPVVHVDETSWWVHGSLAWLWVFTHPRGTFYYIAKSRGREVFEAVMGFAFQGVVVSDCLSIYDFESGLQQKCYSHHLQAVRKALEAAPLPAKEPTAFLPTAKALLKRALALGQTRSLPDFDPATFARERQELDHAADALFALPHDEPQEKSVYQRLSHQRDHLFTFLDQDGVDATNNLAERQLRPAVIARKLSCGNKTMAGVATFQILASLAATCAQTKTSFIHCVAASVPLYSG